MTETAAQSTSPRNKTSLRHRIFRLNSLGTHLPWAVPALLARLIPAWVFWASARTKVDGFSIADGTWWLFENEYALPFIPYAVAAVLATIAEHVFAVCLALGIATRFAAAGVLVMTLVIQIFVYPSAWITHGLWAACCLVLIARGPGALSLDRALRIDI